MEVHLDEMYLSFTPGDFGSNRRCEQPSFPSITVDGLAAETDLTKKNLYYTYLYLYYWDWCINHPIILTMKQSEPSFDGNSIIGAEKKME